MCAPRADFQIVATHDTLVLDLQTRNCRVDGRLMHQSALAQLSVGDARRLRDLLDQALDAAEVVDDPRQTRLWSGAVEARRGLS